MDTSVVVILCVGAKVDCVCSVHVILLVRIKDNAAFLQVAREEVPFAVVAFRRKIILPCILFGSEVASLIFNKRKDILALMLAGLA